jgi:hypothetical protein
MEARDPMFLPQVSASCDFMDAEVEVIANNFSMLRVTPTSSSGPLNLPETSSAFELKLVST